MNYAIVIGASSGGVFVLALVSICLIRLCKRKEVKRPRLDSDIVPVEEALGNREKYELSDKSKGKIFSDKPVEGRLNEAFN